MAYMKNKTKLEMKSQGKTAVIGHLRSVSEIKLDSELVDVTTLDAQGGFRQYAQGMKEMGEVTLEGFLCKEEASQSALRSLYFSGDAAEFVITFPDLEKVTFSALVKSVVMGAQETDGVVKFSCVLKMTGEAVFS